MSREERRAHRRALMQDDAYYLRHKQYDQALATAVSPLTQLKVRLPLQA
jgi:hypothetical protein